MDDLRTGLRAFLQCYLNTYFFRRDQSCLRECTEFGESAIELLATDSPIPDHYRASIRRPIMEALEEAFAVLSVPSVEPEVRGSRPMDENAYVDATTENLRFTGEDGGQSDKLYHVVTILQPWVLIVATTFVNETERILLDTSYRHPIGRTSIGIPAGFMEATDQQNPIATAVRELAEETGYAEPRRSVVLQRRATALDGIVRTAGAYVLLRGVRQTNLPRLEAHEQQADLRTHPCQWSTVLALLDAGLITSATTSAALYMAARHMHLFM